MLATEGEGTLEGDRVRGVLHHVPDAGVASHVVLAASDASGTTSLVAVSSGDAEIEILPTLDATRRLATVRLDGAPARTVGAPGSAAAALEAARRRGAVALAHELVGVAQTALDQATGYAGQREQFGKPIGTYQAVSHRLADMFIAVESARSLAYYAAWAVETGDEAAELAVAQAAVAASDAGVSCTLSNIQVHGGIGMTWEHDAHILVKRARSGAALLGPMAGHLRRVADLIGV